MTEEIQQKKVGIVIICYNISSEIFLLQIAALKKFCKDEFEIIIIDNSTDSEKAEHIRYHASRHGLIYIKTFAGGKNSSDSHSYAANFAYQKFKEDYPFMFFIDHDAMPIREFSVVDILNGGHVMAGIGQGAKKKYLWPGIFLVNNNAIDKNILDFSPNLEYGLDTGGNLYLIIEKYGEAACIFFNEAYPENPYFKSKDRGYYATINDAMFMHMVAGSNWDNKPDYQERISSLINVAKDLTGL